MLKGQLQLPDKVIVFQFKKKLMIKSWNLDCEYILVRKNLSIADWRYRFKVIISLYLLPEKYFQFVKVYFVTLLRFALYHVGEKYSGSHWKCEKLCF